jgi:hypothetical protein
MAFSINAAPLLISELSYPTHVRQSFRISSIGSNLIQARKNDLSVQFVVVFWQCYLYVRSSVTHFISHMSGSGLDLLGQL